MQLKKIFDCWAGKTAKKYSDRQWLLSKWEVIEGIEWPQEKIRLMLAAIAKDLKLGSQDNLVGLGCGGGWILKSLKKRVKETYGLDFAIEMLRIARLNDKKGKFICGEIGRLPFASESFSRVLSYFVFINFSEEYTRRCLLEIYRILKMGGRALIGQIPNERGSKDYDRAKEDYLAYCARVFKLGKDTSRLNAPPIELFDRKELSAFLRAKKIQHEIAPSFNPFWRRGEPLRVSWRFDLILKKK